MLINKAGKPAKECVLDDYDRIVFWGATAENKKVVEKLHLKEKVKYFVDINEEKQKEQMDGYLVYSPDILDKENNVLVLTILTAYAKDIIDSVQKHGNHECFFYLPEQGEHIKQSNNKVLESITPQYIHVFYNTVFLMHFYSMLEEKFCVDNHLFIVDMSIVWDDRFGILEYVCKKNLYHNNIILVRDLGQLQNMMSDDINYNTVLCNSKIDKKIFYSAQIILHSVVFSNYIQSFIYDMIKKGCGKKMIWICWDGDSYYDKDSFIVKKVLSNIGLAFTAEAHIQRITSKCNIKTAILECAPYAYTSGIKKEQKKNTFDGELRVLLGHCAAKHCNHELGFELLYPYHNENIKIYCPLSYGFETYRNHVIEEGYRLFGDKFVPILKYMNPEKYHAFLDSIHIVVFPMKRMAAATTLSYCNATGKQIYMSREMIAAFSNGSGIQADDLSMIKDLNWEEFSSKISHSIQCNLVETNQNIVLLWKKIFDIIPND